MAGEMTWTSTKIAILAATASLAAGAALAQPIYPSRPPAGQPASAARPAPQPEPAEKSDGWGKKTMDIGAQPARDVGLSRKRIPGVLQEAFEDPYGLTGLKTCAKLYAEIQRLNEALGPDYHTDIEYKENRAGKLAEAGGKAIVNSIIPFRSLVREISGAAPADRHLEAIGDAGLARRGFLRGVHLRQGCKQRF